MKLQFIKHYYCIHNQQEHFATLITYLKQSKIKFILTNGTLKFLNTTTNHNTDTPQTR